jgi:hypothetical protein
MFQRTDKGNHCLHCGDKMGVDGFHPLAHPGMGPVGADDHLGFDLERIASPSPEQELLTFK